MSKNNDDFFNIKKPWSEVKDELLSCYLRPYIQKLLTSKNDIVYIDCFAGKGQFEDGKPGSPIIALNIMKECINRSSAIRKQITPIFIDLRYADDLNKNLSPFTSFPTAIYSGNYTDYIEEVLDNNIGSNVFIYIDPYGIKDLDCHLFKSFSNSNKHNSVELLINLNSYGFIREGCRVLGSSFDEDYIFEDLEEYEPTMLEKNQKSIDLLDKIAGGNYWQNIIQDKIRGKITTKEAEILFSEQYCIKLRESYKYVLNMPIRIKQGHPPKYRMVHATNHIDGCLIMVDNINNRWQLMKDIQTHGQLSLFEEDINNNIIDDNELMIKLRAHLSNYKNPEHADIILAEFFMKYGAICSCKHIRDKYKILEKEKAIEVFRNPPYTNFYNKPSTFFTENRNQKVTIRYLL